MAKRLVVAAPLLALALATSWQAVALFTQNLQFTAAQTEIGFWGRGEYQPTPAAVARTRAELNSLLRPDSGNPEYSSLQARFSAWQGFRAATVEQSLALNAEAMAFQLNALQARPAHRQGWQKMLEYASRTPDGAAMLAPAQARVQLLQPAG